MILAPSVQTYLKTTETCQLNCRHCFTSGSNGPKIYFKPKKVIDFFHRLRRDCPWVRSMHVLFHGGEPLLAPLDDMWEAYHGTKDTFPKTSFGIQTNLVYSLTDEKLKFFKEVTPDTFGTSWDYDIRFGSTAPSGKYASVRSRQLKLWEDNVRKIVSEDIVSTMIVSISKKLVEEVEPVDIIQYAIDLGFEYILFERITGDGNAKENQGIFPGNVAQDAWLKKMWDQTIEHKLYEKIGNMLLSELATSVTYNMHVANRCRNCESSLLTLNATGTISGCPNTAPIDHWGHIDQGIMEMLKSNKRMEVITCETERNPVCYECPAFSICNGDCHQLSWEGDMCAAPKSIFKSILEENDMSTYKKLII